MNKRPKRQAGPAKPGPRQIPELQALRGLAAVVVLLHHCSFVFATTPGFRFFFEALFNAHAAVIVFFVLSGFVLTRSLVRVEDIVTQYPTFVVRRIFRILPAVWVIGAIAAIYMQLVHNSLPTAQQSAWYIRMYPQGPVTLKELVMSLFALNMSLIPPIWSVRIELLAAASIPLIALAVKKRVEWWLCLLFLILTLAVFRGSETLLYMNAFLFGAVIVNPPGWLRALCGNPVVMALSLAALMLFRLANPQWRFEIDYAAKFPALVESAAAAVLVLGLRARGLALLRAKWLTWMGDISFSIFLLHFSIMSALAIALGRLPVSPDIAALALMATTLALTLPAAQLSYRFVELPGIELGKVLLNEFRQKRAPLKRTALS